MESHKSFDRWMQAAGLLVLAGLTSALIFAFRQELLPFQQDGNAFETVYNTSLDESSEETSAEVSELGGG